MGNKKVYVDSTQEVKVNGERFAGGAVYEFDTSDEQQARTYENLKATGQVQDVDFANLDALERSINTLVTEHQAKKKNVATHRRYANNEAERDYQLELLEEQLIENVERAKAEYKKELELTERELAQKALAEVHPIDDNVQKFIEQEVALLTYSNNPADDLNLLLLKVQAMDEKQLNTVLRNAGKIKQAVQGNEDAEKVLGEIVAVAKRSNKQAEINLKLKHLQALKKRKVDVAFQTYQKAKRIKEGNY